MISSMSTNGASMPVVGDLNTFAIEYDLTQTDPPFGRARLWLQGFPVGDYDEDMFLYDMSLVLASLIHRHSRKVDIIFSVLSDVPATRTLLERGGWSFGEAFDCFFLLYYATLDDDVIHWHWKFVRCGMPVSDFDLATAHHCKIEGKLFDPVASEYLLRLGIVK